MLILTESATGYSILLDCVLETTHTSAAEVTDHPVETGADVSDNVIQKPDELRLHSIVSNTPLVPGLRGDGNRGQSAYEALLLFKESGSSLNLVTPLRAYTGMVITGLTAPEQANALDVTVTLRHVRTVDSQQVAAPVPKVSHPGAQGKKPLGRKQGSPAPPPVDANTSLAVQGLQALGVVP